jgi:cation diffusion facilitator CzcD-associated flavoprotein CzcO
VVGGANSAGQAALFLASRGSHVHLIIRRNELSARMSDGLVRRVRKHRRFEVHLAAEVAALLANRVGRPGSAAASVRDEAPRGIRHPATYNVTRWNGSQPLRRRIRFNSVRPPRDHQRALTTPPLKIATTNSELPILQEQSS